MAIAGTVNDETSIWHFKSEENCPQCLSIRSCSRNNGTDIVISEFQRVLNFVRGPESGGFLAEETDH